MAVRSGKEFIDGLRRAPREVWAAGRKVTDVTADPMFARPVHSIAELYDLQVSPAHRETMTVSEDGGEYGAPDSAMIAMEQAAPPPVVAPQSVSVPAAPPPPPGAPFNPGVNRTEVRVRVDFALKPA